MRSAQWSRRQAERLQRAVALHRAGKLDEAEAIYRGVLRTHPAQPDALNFLGMLTYQRGSHEEALRLMRRATETAPNHADAFNNFGNVLRSVGRIEEAEASYRRALALNPQDANVHCNLAAALNARGEIDAAESACRRALELDPRHTGAHTNLGLVLQRQGRRSDAMAAYTAAIGCDPTHPEASKLLGLALLAESRTAEACAVYRRWIEHDPDNPVAAHLLAACAGAEAPARASDDYVRSEFDRMADRFDAHLDALEYRAPALLEQAVGRRLGAGAQALRVLDAGCGTGLCGHFLRRYARWLVGVDLSPRMLARAAESKRYDALLECELTAHLAARPGAYDLVACADTFCYFGDLEAAIGAACTALAAHGSFVFTLERAAESDHGPGYVLAPHGRYAHSESYARKTLGRAGFGQIGIETAFLRNEGANPVTGLVCIATRQAQQRACDAGS